MSIQNAVSSVHQGGLGHLPGDQSGYMTFPINALDPTLMVRDPVAGSQAAFDVLMSTTLSGKVLCGLKQADGSILYVGYLQILI